MRIGYGGSDGCASAPPARLSSTLLQRRLRRREPRDRHAVRRRADVIEPQPLAKPDRGRVAAMLAADAELDTGPGLAPARRRDLDQFADALDIDADERVGRIDALVDIGRQEASGIVAAHPERGLRQIVGPEREERGRSEEHTSE